MEIWCSNLYIGIHSFHRNEYYPVDLNAAPTQDVTLPASQEKTTPDAEVDQNDVVHQKEKKGGGKKRAQR